MSRKLKLLLLAIPALLALGACGGGVYIAAPPPPPRYGVVGVAPGPGYIWAEGFWDWRGGAWVWAPGSWMRAPRRGAVWVPAHWVPYGRSYRFIRGHWRR